MNTRPSCAVSGGIRWPWRLAMALLFTGIFCSNFQCVAIDGGASEFTWSLRTFGGAPVDPCSTSKISHIRLCWNSLDEGVRGCRPGQFRDFLCEDHSGVTLFEIPPGPTRLFVEPICEDGLAPAPQTYQAPPDIVRTVRDGEVVTLDSMLIVVTDQPAGCGIECTCVR